MPLKRGKSEPLRASQETYDTLTEHKAVSIGDEEVVLEMVTMFFKHVATQQTTVPKTRSGLAEAAVLLQRASAF